MRYSLSILLLGSILLCACSSSEKRIQLLVFSKTEGYRHSSIETGIEVIQGIAESSGYLAHNTEDSSLFTEENLNKYSAVIFLNTSGDILNDEQEAAFEKYMQAGGGFVGVHAATDTEYDWSWYGQLVGAYFDSHPAIQEASLIVTDPDHATVAHLPNPFVISDEWYNFYNISANINPVLMIDETSYEGGTNGGYHPASWYQEYDGGRSFYTALGHLDETFLNPLFIQHLKAGIDYTIGH